MTVIRAARTSLRPIREVVVLTHQGRVFVHPVGIGQFVVGRSSAASIRIDDPDISRKHARVWVHSDRIEIEDCGSTNGTCFKGRRMTPGCRQVLGAGVAVELAGVITLLVRGTAPNADSLHDTLSRRDFIARVERECREPSWESSGLAIVSVEASSGTSPIVKDSLLHDLRAWGVVTQDTESRILVLMSCDHGLIDSELDRMQQLCNTRRVHVVTRRALYPHDGVTAGELLERLALAGLHDEGFEPTGTGRFAPGAETDPMDHIHRLVRRLAPTELSVLLQGETGSGKGYLARLLHLSSNRAAAPFITVNCGAIAPTLLESELFGHARGAFTGAVRARKGLIVAADHGTLFLDEVGDLPLDLQVKLLHVLEDGVFRPVGSSASVSVDVRVIAASNRELSTLTVAEAFRSDLYYRLNGATICVPPLRQRRAELGTLAQKFAAEAAERNGISVPEIPHRTMAKLHAYRWPGNIRELRNVIERAVVLGEGVIEPEDLLLQAGPGRGAHESFVAKAGPSIDAPDTRESSSNRTATVEFAEPSLRHLTVDARLTRDRIIEVLSECAGNQTRAAEELGVGRSTLCRWLTKYDIARPRGPKGRRIGRPCKTQGN
jgi:DNA-binding NtrC family response regulator